MELEKGQKLRLENKNSNRKSTRKIKTVAQGNGHLVISFEGYKNNQGINRFYSAFPHTKNSGIIHHTGLTQLRQYEYEVIK